MIDKVEKIWLDGKLVSWEQAQVHVLTHALHYGTAAFEGIRCYKLQDGRSAVFRLTEHIGRLFDSAKIADLSIPWKPAEVCQACLETVRANRLDECYIRPIAFVGDGDLGVYVKDNPIRLAIAVWRWGAYLGDDGLRNGIRVRVSSYARPAINTVMSKAKIAGNYINSFLAKREAVATGYQEAVMLDTQGYVSEASGENIFMIKRGQVYTPPLGCSVLAGITRDTVIVLCADLGLQVTERLISRDELYIADEVFFTGTAAEVTPVREIDNRKVGNGSRGPITERIQERFFHVVRGSQKVHSEWLAMV
jgi:branched-chain amino acid aminotransferase